MFDLLHHRVTYEHTESGDNTECDMGATMNADRSLLLCFSDKRTVLPSNQTEWTMSAHDI